ncbi:hypothetical protein CC85DRAFT_27648 [Cutaneotrichosporon oleaginosum]|uniref:Uncharacterized protein n=1 Tax=Cutaneotrichosporon oleaginosum TaxID=879819 RepID=A0A0J0XBQ2_9TREE|nr:uncharacterized protein CC85DRAFT_27648 [Cutaneotrichosporon oleaginosum]KLT38503.1 hypothetical protein CC85DRAFT_27648 [Cutaneotrichosporon oleaginosum]TXT12305.1 hypothetical protein COLE_02715 [Cutaneotrichosporon oleaginosum]
MLATLGTGPQLTGAGSWELGAALGTARKDRPCLLPVPPCRRRGLCLRVGTGQLAGSADCCELNLVLFIPAVSVDTAASDAAACLRHAGWTGQAPPCPTQAAVQYLPLLTAWRGESARCHSHSEYRGDCVAGRFEIFSSSISRGREGDLYARRWRNSPEKPMSVSGRGSRDTAVGRWGGRILQREEMDLERTREIEQERWSDSKQVRLMSEGYESWSKLGFEEPCGDVYAAQNAHYHLAKVAKTRMVTATLPNQSVTRRRRRLLFHAARTCLGVGGWRTLRWVTAIMCVSE